MKDKNGKRSKHRKEAEGRKNKLCPQETIKVKALRASLRFASVGAKRTPAGRSAPLKLPQGVAPRPATENDVFLACKLFLGRQNQGI